MKKESFTPIFCWLCAITCSLIGLSVECGLFPPLNIVDLTAFYMYGVGILGLTTGWVNVIAEKMKNDNKDDNLDV